MSIKILVGDVLDRIREIPEESVQCVVTSPPYWGLRDYGVDGQIGFENTPECYVEKLVGVFREVRRVLRGDGTVWLNLGDSYSANRTYQVESGGLRDKTGAAQGVGGKGSVVPKGLKPKDLVGIPWRVAFALQADGWYLRQDIIWAKPNPMPESVKDRCTKAHEYIFMLTKSERYFYDAEAIAEKCLSTSIKKFTDNKQDKQRGHSQRHAGFNGRYAEKIKNEGVPEKRNKRSVWTVSTHRFKEAHFATFPPELIRPCILAGSKEGDTVLDPFGGAGTTGLVCQQSNRDAILIELNPDYAEMSRERLDERRLFFGDTEVV